MTCTLRYVADTDRVQAVSLRIHDVGRHPRSAEPQRRERLPCGWPGQAGREQAGRGQAGRGQAGRRAGSGAARSGWAAGGEDELAAGAVRRVPARRPRRSWPTAGDPRRIPGMVRPDHRNSQCPWRPHRPPGTVVRTEDPRLPEINRSPEGSVGCFWMVTSRVALQRGTAARAGRRAGPVKRELHGKAGAWRWCAGVGEQDRGHSPPGIRGVNVHDNQRDRPGVRDVPVWGARALGLGGPGAGT
jgi:hypothetical protein